MIRRTFSTAELVRAVGDMLDEIGSRFNPGAFLADHDNIVLVNDEGDVGIMEPHGSPYVYKVHYFFLQRGKEAVKASKAFLTEAFTNYPCHLMMGFTPIDKKGAMWMTRHLGFKPLSVETINGRDFQVWTMHKKEYMNV